MSSGEFEFTITISEDGNTVEGLVQKLAGPNCGHVSGIIADLGEEVEHRHTADYDRPTHVRTYHQTKRYQQVR